MATKIKKNQTASEILNDPEEKKRRTRYMYWVVDKTNKDGGYYKLVKSEDEVPKGFPTQVYICMG